MRLSRGFTLIEVMMAAALTALVGLAIYANFATGIRVMKKLTQPSGDADLYIFFEKFSRDLENAFLYNGIPFHGEKEKLSFATTILTEAVLGGERGIGRVTYSYESGRNSIGRAQENVSQIYQDEEAEARPILDQIYSLTFRYYKYNAKDKIYLWKEEWDEEEEENKNPVAVRIDLEFKDEEGKHSSVKTIAIPAAGQ